MAMQAESLEVLEKAAVAPAQARAIVRAIAIEGEAQLIFVDTPGIFAPRRRLDETAAARKPVLRCLKIFR